MNTDSRFRNNIKEHFVKKSAKKGFMFFLKALKWVLLIILPLMLPLFPLFPLWVIVFVTVWFLMWIG